MTALGELLRSFDRQIKDLNERIDRHFPTAPTTDAVRLATGAVIARHTAFREMGEGPFEQGRVSVVRLATGSVIPKHIAFREMGEEGPLEQGRVSVVRSTPEEPFGHGFADYSFPPRLDAQAAAPAAAQCSPEAPCRHGCQDHSPPARTPQRARRSPTERSPTESPGGARRRASLDLVRPKLIELLEQRRRQSLEPASQRFLRSASKKVIEARAEREQSHPCRCLDRLTASVIDGLGRFAPPCLPPQDDVMPLGIKYDLVGSPTRVEEHRDAAAEAAWETRQMVYLGSAGREWMALARQAEIGVEAVPAGHTPHILNFIDSEGSAVEITVYSTINYKLMHTVPPSTLQWLFEEKIRSSATAQQDFFTTFLSSNPKLCISVVNPNDLPDPLLYAIDTRFALMLRVDPSGILVAVPGDALSPVGRIQADFQCSLCEMKKKGITDEKIATYCERMERINEYKEFVSTLTHLQTHVRFYIDHMMKEMGDTSDEVRALKAREEMRIAKYLDAPLESDGYEIFLNYLRDFRGAYQMYVEARGETEDSAASLKAFDDVIKDCERVDELITAHSQTLLLYRTDRGGMEEHFEGRSPQRVARARIPPKILSPDELVKAVAKLPGATSADRAVKHTEIDAWIKKLTVEGLFLPTRCCERTADGHVRFRMDLSGTDKRTLAAIVGRAIELGFRIVIPDPNLLPLARDSEAELFEPIFGFSED